jgi:hypothetical protein
LPASVAYLGNQANPTNLGTDFTENALMRHVSIGFLPEGFHPLHRFLSLRVCSRAPGEAGAIQPVEVRSGKGVAPAR